jgi:hypothetical protein
MKIDLNLVSEVEFENIRGFYGDAYVSFALYDGEVASDEILDELNYNQDSWKYEKLLDYVQ